MADPEPQANMHALFREARRQTALVRDPAFPAPVLIAHADVDRLVASKTARCQEGEILSLTGITAEPIWAFWRQIMFSKNGAEHRRLRKIVHEGYTPAAVNPERPVFRTRAHELIDDFDPAGPIELVSRFVEPIVGFGICHRAGYGEEDRQRIMGWGRIATRIFTGLLPEDQDEVAAAFTSMFEHLDEVIARRKAEPQDRLIDTLIAAECAGAMTYEELRAMMGNIVIGGYATTQHAVIGLTWYLLNDPHSLEKVRANPARVAAALKEVLRLEPPVDATFRTALEDLKAGGCPFKKGETVMISILSANRDESAYTEPDRFDMERENARPLSFGAGPHRCLGAALATAIAEEALLALLERAPNLALASQAAGWTPAEGYREFDSLFVRV